MCKSSYFAVLGAILLMMGCAATGPSGVSFSNGVMVNSAGMTLYTFDRDPVGGGKSVCNDKCAALWPPLRAGASDSAGGDFTIITRDDGSRQWAHRGKPLYTWIKDTKPGDRTGDNFNKVWRVIEAPRFGLTTY
jgi:predicted lipoprotein with Yx(FWY)xxD motif